MIAPDPGDGVPRQLPRPRHHEAVLAVQRTVRCIDDRLDRLLAAHGISPAQHAVLRILRDAGDTGLATLTIAARMVDRAPGITRLIDRLERRGLVRRERGQDRRQVFCHLTPRGLELIAPLDAELARIEEAALSALTVNEIGALVHLLDRVYATSVQHNT